MSVHVSWRCSTCARSWPMHDDAGVCRDTYKQCPVCGTNTWRSTGDPDANWDEARREASYFEFERYLERREQADRKLLEQVKPAAFAQYMMDSAEEQIEREQERAEHA